MKLGVANKESWSFFADIFSTLSDRHTVEVFEIPEWRVPILEQKMAHYLLRHRLNSFIHSCDVAFFEWASELLVEASDLHTADAAALVTRLHRYEMFRWAERINWGAVSYVILNSETMRQKLLERTSVRPEQTVVLPNAIDLTRANSGPRPFTGKIGTLASLLPRKRIYELILAFHALLQHEPDLTLHIGGPVRRDYRAYYEALHALCRRLGIEDRVTFYGKVEDQWAWHQSIDIFVSFSYSEGMQVSPMEAAASGCYCLSHWWEGADELFPQEQLFISESEFVEKVLHYVRAPEREQLTMRAPFRNFVEQECDLPMVSNAIDQLLLQAFEERKRRTTAATRTASHVPSH